VAPLVAGSILLVTHFYPPSGMVAARRPAGLAKYLERQGYRVTVLTSGGWGERPDEDEPASCVRRTGDLMQSRLNWRRKNLRAWTGEGGPAEYAAGASRLARVLVPDVAIVTWLPMLLPGAINLARRKSFDCVVTTSGPESVHIAGLALRQLGGAWIADLRDGWGFETLHDWPTSAQRRLDRGLERLVAQRADALTAVSEPIAEDLRHRLGADAHTITNAYDPDEVPPRVGASELLSPDRHSLVHTGRMASSQRSPGPVVEALRLLRRQSPAVAAGLEVVFAGPLTPGERALLESPDLEGSVRLVGSLPRAEALHLQREADSLLLLTAGNRRGEATGKLYEYLGAEHPILVLGQDTEAARIVRDARAGTVVAAHDPAAIAAGLEALVAGEAPSAPAPQAYSYPEVARQFAEVVELARERARRRRSTR
jgi:glycosyltransferase involved in cell wall biosynthesis